MADAMNMDGQMPGMMEGMDNNEMEPKEAKEVKDEDKVNDCCCFDCCDYCRCAKIRV